MRPHCFRHQTLQGHLQGPLFQVWHDEFGVEVSASRCATALSLTISRGCADGASQCVELMGCFSALEVQQAAARVCAALAWTGPEACSALLDADIGSMLQQHIKEPETTLCMFENAAHVVSALASTAGEVCPSLSLVHPLSILSAAVEVTARLCWHRFRAEIRPWQMLTPDCETSRT
jgi:hypothetical protein